MSLFENDQYRWRDTYFVLFNESDRPATQEVLDALQALGARYTIPEARSDEQGRLESLTLISPDDFAAMDITYIFGEEVVEQVGTLIEELGIGQSDIEAERIKRLRSCDARFDIYHFEQVMLSDDDDDEGFFDPGALLIVLQRLAKLCKGTGVDPQAGTIV